MLAAGALVATAPTPASAQGLVEEHVLNVEPSCGKSFLVNEFGDYIQLAVRGYGFEPGLTMAFTFDGQPAKVIGASIVVDDYGTFAGTIEAFQAARDGVFWVVASDINNPQFGTWAQYTAPCPPAKPTITISPDCFDAGVPTTVHVTGSGWRDGFEIRTGIINFTDSSLIYVVSDPITSSGGTWQYDLPFTAPENGIYRVTAVQSVRGFAIAAQAGYYINQYIVVPCPVLTVTPFCENPGTAPDRWSLIISGTQFLPDRSLEIVFDPDGTPASYLWDYTVADDGSWGPEEINPYARGPGTYDVLIRQFEYTETERIMLHETRVPVIVPCPEAMVELTPDCAPPQLVGDTPRGWLLTATGTGFQPGQLVTFTFDADLVTPTFFQESREDDADRFGVASVSIEARARPAGNYRVRAQQIVGDAVIEGSATFRSPCRAPRPSLTIDPSCGRDAPGEPAAYEIDVAGKGFVPGYAEVIFDEAGTKETFKTFAIGDRTITTTIRPTGRSPGDYLVVARQQDLNGVLAEATATFTVTCAEPTKPVLTITPSTAPPGFVVRVVGAGFPKDSTIFLRWSDGIGAATPIQVPTDPDGGFDRQVLIFKHDFLGLRTMTAATSADGEAIPDVSADLLVGLGRGLPPVFNVFGVNPGEPQQIVNRR